MRTYSMKRGGFRYEDASAPSYGSTVMAYLPALSVLPLLQHAGEAAKILVEKGQELREGMLIGRGSGKGSANVHATVPGRVLRIIDYTSPDGRSTQALVVRLGGSFERLGRREESFSWNALSAAALQRTLDDKGVVDMDGNGEPLADRVADFRSRKEPVTLALYCLTDDPWMVAEYAVCRERLESVVDGLAILKMASNAKRIVLAFSDLALMESLRSAADAKKLALDCVVVQSRYPQRNRQELSATIEAADRAERRSTGPLFLVSPSTLVAACDAIKHNKPLMERYIAVGGDAVKHPSILKVRIGTRVGDVIAECGGFTEKVQRLCFGSPLTGSVITDLDTPITKTCSAIVALSARQVGGNKLRDCIGCGECRNVCPVALDPERLYKLLMQTRILEARAEGADLCHGCGCCAAICPSRLELRTVIFTPDRKKGITE